MPEKMSPPRPTRSRPGPLEELHDVTIVTTPTKTSASRNFLRQYQARRRAITSSSRSCWLSAPKRLGQGIRRRKSEVGEAAEDDHDPEASPSSAQHQLQPSYSWNQMKTAGLVRTATIVAARVSARHWSASSVRRRRSMRGQSVQRLLRSRHFVSVDGSFGWVVSRPLSGLSALRYVPRHDEATIHTSEGPIELELFPDEAPKTVENFTKLADDGFYDGVTSTASSPTS